MEAYQTAVYLDPSSPFFNICWSGALQKVGKQADSEVRLKKAFELDPNFTSKFLVETAVEKYRQGDKKGAFQILGETLQNNPFSADAFYCRGILYLQEKKKSLALKDLEAAKSLNPTPEKNPSIQSLDQFIEQAKE